MKNPKVSVIILSYNSRKYLKNCVESLLIQSYNNLEIFFIDNGSSDGSFEFIQKNYNDINFNLIKNKKNIGYASGNNQGIQKSTGEYVLLLNPDVILETDYIKNIINNFEEINDIGAATGKILKFKQLEEKIEKTNIIDSLGLKINKSHRITELKAGSIDNKEFDKNKELFGVSAAAAIYRKRALEDVKNISKNNNYFDEDLYIYKEDIDLSWRMQHAGWKSYYVSDAVAYHDRWETGSSRERREIITSRKEKSNIVNYYSYRNHLIINLKNEYSVNLVISSPMILYYEIKKFMFLLFFERKTLKGLLDFIKTLPLTIQKRNAILSKSKLKSSEIRRWF